MSKKFTYKLSAFKLNKHIELFKKPCNKYRLSILS